MLGTQIANRPFPVVNYVDLVLVASQLEVPRCVFSYIAKLTFPTNHS